MPVIKNWKSLALKFFKNTATNVTRCQSNNGCKTQPVDAVLQSSQSCEGDTDSHSRGMLAAPLHPFRLSYV